jgi:osmotically-inducible protein OsmY
MRQSLTQRIPLVLTLAIMVGAFGCQQTAKGLEQDAKKNGASIEAGAKEAGEQASQGAEKAAEAVSTATDSAAASAAAAAATLEVKTALMADKRVDASRIDVDSDGVLKVIHIRGMVVTAAEIPAATEIATAKAPAGWRVSNELVVAPKLP